MAQRSAAELARALPGMSTKAPPYLAPSHVTKAPSHAMLNVLPPPPDPRYVEETSEETTRRALNDILYIVKKLFEFMQEHARDLETLTAQVEALQRDVAMEQDSRSAFISRLTSALHEWDPPEAQSHEPEGGQQEEEQEEENRQEEPEEENWQEDREHGGEPSSKKQRSS